MSQEKSKIDRAFDGMIEASRKLDKAEDEIILYQGCLQGIILIAAVILIGLCLWLGVKHIILPLL